jgi:uncharacterized repeat protein (TIGR03803 family)
MTSVSKWRKTLLLVSLVSSVSASAQSFRTLLVFNGTNGAKPVSTTVQGVDGDLYGTTSIGGLSPYAGTVFKIGARGLTVLHSFCLQCIDGANPQAGLLLASDGNFYGTTAGGGAHNKGTVFKVTEAGVLTILHSFCADSDCPDGAGPTSWLIEGPDGELYGTTANGGRNFKRCSDFGPGCGTIFRLTTGGTLTTLYNFCSRTDCTDGRVPNAGLTAGTDANFYGTTTYGGADDEGTVFKLTPGGTFVSLHAFRGSDGSNPNAGIVQGVDGDLYGVTEFGGEGNDSEGTVFVLTPEGAYTLLHSFDGNDGAYPQAALIQATDGNFYGTTSGGGLGQQGTLFSIAPGGFLTTLYRFQGTQQGDEPLGGLFQHTSGVLYGTTPNGGDLMCEAPNGCGTIFSLDVGLGPFVAFVRPYGKVGQTDGILGQGFEGVSEVSFNGVPANFEVRANIFLTATVPPGATTGYVTVTSPTGVLTSNVPFHVIQ